MSKLGALTVYMDFLKLPALKSENLVFYQKSQARSLLKIVKIAKIQSAIL